MTAYQQLPTSAPHAINPSLWAWPSVSSASSSTAHPGGRPSFVQAATARPLRLALYSAGVVVTLLVIAGSAGRGPVPVRQLASGTTSILDSWRPRPGNAWRELPQNDGLVDPTYVVGKDGYLYPPDVYPAALNPYKRANAALVSLVRNNEKDSMRDSMRYVIPGSCTRPGSR